MPPQCQNRCQKCWSRRLVRWRSHGYNLQWHSNSTGGPETVRTTPVWEWPSPTTLTKTLRSMRWPRRWGACLAGLSCRRSMRYFSQAPWSVFSATQYSHRHLGLFSVQHRVVTGTLVCFQCNTVQSQAPWSVFSATQYSHRPLGLFSVQHNTVQDNTVWDTSKGKRQYSTRQYNAVQYNTVTITIIITIYFIHPSGKLKLSFDGKTIQCSTIQYSTRQYNAAQCNTVQDNTMQYNAIWYKTIQCNTRQYTHTA